MNHGLFYGTIGVLEAVLCLLRAVQGEIKMLKRIVGLLLVLLVLAVPAAADDFEEGSRAYDRGDYTTAYKKWAPLAEQGDADAQFNLGLMLDKKSGKLGGTREAVTWYYRAAEQGDADAQYRLGLLYSAGDGALPKDDQKAAQWFRRAAEQEHADAQFMLGNMYFMGLGVPKDQEEAQKWLDAAEKFGCLDCPAPTPPKGLFD